jgi:purine-binding chemotaxis protein CheW
MNEIIRYLCFGLGQEEYAIPLLVVKEVIGVPEVTPIPQTPSHFLGIMNLRGNVISIMDLRHKLGIKPSQSEETTVVILDFGDYNLGVVVDRVNAVISLASENISPKPVVESSKATDYLTGVFRKGEQLVLLLDIARALSVEDRSAISKKQAHAAA